jgi:non-specific serine/threonine protein kinase
VWFVELAGLHDAELVPPTIAAALGMQSRAERTAVGSLTSYLAEREVLLILDNCEHLVDACAIIVAELLRTCPGTRILATSREPLCIGGERVFSVSPLAVPAPGEAVSVQQAAEYPAVRLFIERAAAAQPGFELTIQNRASVEEICRRLDGMPLALELAAGRLRALSPEQLQQRLDDRFELLTGGSRAALPRQQTLRALVDWSFDLCTPMEQLLWGWLSVFEGSFGLEAAEIVCSGGDIPADKMLYVIAGLVDKSIVATGEGDGELNYHLLETLREYGRERLREPEREAIARRHRDYYAGLVEQAEQEWFSATQLPQLANLRRAHPNLRAALRYSLRDSDEARTGLAIAASLRFYWLISGYIVEGVHWLARLLAVYEHRDVVRLKALRVQAHLAARIAETALAERLMNLAQALAEEVDDPSEAAYVKQSTGIVALFQGQPQRAADLLLDAAERHECVGDDAAVAYDRIHAAVPIGLLGEPERAAELVESVLPTCRASGDHWTTSLALFMLGIEACRVGDCDRSAELQRESIHLRLPLDDRYNLGLNFEALAWAATGRGEMEPAARLFGASFGLLEAVGTPLIGPQYLNALHERYEAQAMAQLGRDRFERIREEGRRMPFRQVVALALGETPRSGVEAPPPPARPANQLVTAFAQLTRREWQIAELVANGLTNKDIAARLVISIRTAEGHVEHVLSKLNFTSRTQVATWVTMQRAQEDSSHD